MALKKINLKYNEGYLFLKNNFYIFSLAMILHHTSILKLWETLHFDGKLNEIFALKVLKICDWKISTFCRRMVEIWFFFKIINFNLSLNRILKISSDSWDPLYERCDNQMCGNKKLFRKNYHTFQIHTKKFTPHDPTLYYSYVLVHQQKSSKESRWFISRPTHLHHQLKLHICNTTFPH